MWSQTESTDHGKGLSVTRFAKSPVTTAQYVHFSTSLERIDPDEKELTDKIIDSLHQNNVRAYEKHQHAVRDAHAKSHAILVGELTVSPGLGAHLAQGLFAEPRSYPVIARLSTTAGEIRSDQVHGVRAIAVKVLEVEGQRLDPTDGHSTQDFVMVNSPTFPFADIRAYAKGQRFASLLAQTPDAVLKVASPILRMVNAIGGSIGLPLRGAPALLARPNTYILGETFHSASPLRYGEYVAKISFAPLSESVKDLTGRRLRRGTGYDAHSKLVTDFFHVNSAVYEVRAQLCTDPDAMSIDDARVDWPERLSSHQRIGTLTFPAQEAYSPARRVYGDDVLAFNSWNGLAAHQPLGGINRLKRRVYDASSDYRHRMNNVERKEPSDIRELPQ